MTETLASLEPVEKFRNCRLGLDVGAATMNGRKCSWGRRERDRERESVYVGRERFPRHCTEFDTPHTPSSIESKTASIHKTSSYPRNHNPCLQWRQK